MRQRKHIINWERTTHGEPTYTNDSYTPTIKKLLFTLSIALFIIVCLWQTIKFLHPAHIMTYVVRNQERGDSHYIKSQAKRVTKFLQTHKDGYGFNAINKYFIYPRLNTSVNIFDFPESLQTHKFCGYNNNCTESKLCHCPYNTSSMFGSQRYPELKFPPNIYDYGWQKHFNIGYPPPFNVSLIVNDSHEKVQNAWNLYNKRTSLGYCNNSAGMWEQWTKPGYHKCIARIIGEKLKFKPGKKVLDIGSGCGHTLAQWTYWFGVFAMGFDFQIRNVQYANNIAIRNKLNYVTFHASLQSLYIDNWIPQKSFDYVFSKAALMYLGKDSICLVIKKVIDILKSGGTAWFAWNDKIKAIKQCIQTYRNDVNNTINIKYSWLNESDFLGSCHKIPQRPSLIVKRID